MVLSLLVSTFGKEIVEDIKAKFSSSKEKRVNKAESIVIVKELDELDIITNEINNNITK